MDDFQLNKHSDELDQFLSTSEDGVFYVGHASILVRLSKKLFLFDPVCQRPPYLESWIFFPPQVMDPRLLNVDAVIVSHCHQDHFDPEFLRQLNPSVDIYIVGGRPVFRQMCEKEGLKVKEIPPLQKVSIAGGVTVFGALHEYNSVDSSLVIQNDNLSVYHGNDNYVTAKTLEPMKKAVGDVHVGCIPFSFIHWYPFLLDGVSEEWRKGEAKRLIEHYLDLGIEQAQLLGAQVVIPFGANLVFHDFKSEMSKAVVSPFDFVEYAQKKLGSESERYLPMFAGGIVLKAQNEPLRTIYKKIEKNEFMAEMEQFLSERKSKRVHDSRAKIEQGLACDLSWLSNRLSEKANKRLDHYIFIESADADALKIQVDLNDFSARKVENWDTSKSYHHFRVEPAAMKGWLEQEVTFEEVIGTRRFRLTRVPEKYNIDVLEIINNSL